MTSRSTLIILTPGFPSDEHDTTCLPAQQCFIRTLNKIFPDLKVVVVAIQYPYRAGRYTWHGNTVIALNSKNMPRLLRPLFWVKTCLRLGAIRSHSRLVGVLSFWCLEEALIGRLFSKWKGTRHLSWISGQDARKTNPFIRWMRPRPDSLVAMSEFLADELERNFKIRPKYLIPNAIDPAAYTGLPVKTLDILGVGSLIPLKQYGIFVDVIAALVSETPSLKAVLCGAGPEMEMLKKKIAALNLSENIELAGELPHPDVLTLMQQSKIMLHPSSYEGYSTVCLEALYAGCHVVSFVVPEKRQMKHWHKANSKDEMIGQCKSILEQESDFSRILLYDMDDSARNMLAIFDYPATT